MLTKEQYFEHVFTQMKECILSIDKGLVEDIYALSFWKHDLEDDPRYPTVLVGYNTNNNYNRKINKASSKMEAKWNYAFWLQNELLYVGGDEELIKMLEHENIFYSDEDLELAEDSEDGSLWDELLVKDNKIQSLFMDIIIQAVEKLHNDGVIFEKFGRAIPILIHELEYYELPISWTIKANPKHLISDWLAFANGG